MNVTAQGNGFFWDVACEVELTKFSYDSALAATGGYLMQHRFLPTTARPMGGAYRLVILAADPSSLVSWPRPPPRLFPDHSGWALVRRLGVGCSTGNPVALDL